VSSPASAAPRTATTFPRSPPRSAAPRKLATLLASALLCLLALSSTAHAIYGPQTGGLGAEIVSVDNASDEQGNASTADADVSADGRYVVFQTKATNFFEDDGVPGGDPEPEGGCRIGGVFRYDRLTGRTELVADGTELALNAAGECDATKTIFTGAANPSVSADGRYVAFSTAQQLVSQDTNDNIDVYVRDMDVPLSADRKDSGAYKLVSALDGSEDPPAYDESSVPTPIPGGDPGADLWPNTSISADGNYVLFRSAELRSSLPGGGALLTPKNQLFVRDVAGETTTLVTRSSASGEPAGGANGPASISADGTTVAWLGFHAPAQTTFLPGETAEEESGPYYLWRRWAQPGATTRRVTGIADPEDPECRLGEGVTQNPIALGPCYGPLTFPEASLTGLGGVTPALSADGYTVAFLAGSSLRPNVLKADALDLFLASMRPGVTRKAGTTELTLAENGTTGDGNASIDSVALSSDGTHLAFVSQRNAFVLAEPTPVGSFSATPQQNELYVVDLASNTLERAVLGAGGGELNGSTVGSPTISADGTTIAFTSSASNLIAGDANAVTDAFSATLQAPSGVAPPPAAVNSTQGGFSISTSVSPELGLHVKRGKGGALILLVETPGPGKLTARATGTIAVKQAKKHKAKKKKVVLASGSGVARSEGTTTITLRLSSKYQKELSSRGSLEASISVALRPTPSGEVLESETEASFKLAVKKHAKAPRPAKSKRR
jgi:Tol biopolymer transport system component